MASPPGNQVPNSSFSSFPGVDELEKAIPSSWPIIKSTRMVGSTRYRRPSPLESCALNALDIAAGRRYRKSLFKFTVKRSEFCNYFEDTYDCTYKFDVHAGDDAGVLTQEGSSGNSDVTSESVSFYRPKIPLYHLAADDCGGIILIVVVQWDVPHPSADDVHVMHLGTQDRAFFVSKSCSRKLDSSLGDIISPILFGLDILSPDHNYSISSHLISSAISVYRKTKEDKEPWVPMVVKIANQRNRAGPELQSYDDYVFGLFGTPNVLSMG